MRLQHYSIIKEYTCISGSKISLNTSIKLCVRARSKPNKMSTLSAKLRIVISCNQQKVSSV